MLYLLDFIAFFGGRAFVQDTFIHRPDLFLNPILRVLVVFSIGYILTRNIKYAAIWTFVYVIFLAEYVEYEHKYIEKKY